MTKRVLALITALCLAFGMIPAVFAAETGSGTLDNGMTWVLDESGTLTVSGTGPMIDFEELDDVPWYAYASSITQIVVEPGITTIGDLAFCGYNNVTSVSLPEGITSIGKSGISECRNLTDLTLPEGLESIGEMAFFANDSLAVLELPASVRTIGDRAFSNCESLLSMTVPEGVTEIGEHTFSWCESMTEINLPGTITTIGPDAFYHCHELTNFIIPENVTAIADNTFLSCYALTAIDIPEGVTSIGYRAFYHCDGLTTVSIPASVTSIGDEAFALCRSLTGFQVDENNPVFTNADDGTLYSKDFTTLYQVPGVTTSFVIPNTVTNVNYGAFRGCYGLTDVEIPDSVTTIGDWAFGDCDMLTTVVIPDSVTEIGKYSFFGLDSLSNVTLSANLTVIPYRTFKECAALTQITLPDGLQSIDNEAFSTCSSLTEISIPAAVTTVGSSAFENCSSLWEVHFLGDAPVFGGNDVFDSVTANCFYPADNATWTEEVMQDYGGTLTWVTEGTEVPEPPTEPSLPVDPDDPYAGICGNDMIWEFDPDSGTLTITGTGRMDYVGAAPWSEYMPQVTTVIIGEGVTDLCVDAFHTEIGSSIMTSVSLPSTLKSIPERTFFGCAIEEIAMPQWLSHIGREAFSYSNIREAIIPDSVTSIGENAFSGCSNLVSVTLPTDLETLYDGAFSNCENLTEVIKPHMPWFGHIYENTFGNCTSLSDVSWFNWNEIPALTFQAIGVTDLIFHPQVDTIGNQAFQNCANLTTITFHDGITYIGMETFRDCENLTTMYFEGDCPEFSLDCFKNVTATCYYPADNDTWTAASMDNSILGGNLTWVAEGEEPEPTEPSQPTEPSEPSEPSEPEDQPDDSGVWGDNLTWELYGTTLYISGEGEMAALTDEFPWNKYSETVTCLILEEGITSTAYHSFFWFKSLTSVSLPESLQVIGPETFLWCSSLYDITLPERLITLGDRAFEGCESLTEIELPDTLTEISWDCFNGTGLIQIDIPDSVTSIGTRAFMDCKDLVSVNMPEQLTLIGERAFAGCDSLTSLTLPDSLEVIEIAAFEESGLVSIVLPDSVTDLHHYVFYSCANLEAVLVPDSVVYIGEQVFANCPNLTVYCYNLSHAHLYAEAYGIPYQLLDEDPSTPVYDITVTCNAGGTAVVEANPSPANRYVILEVQPKDGYVLDAIYYLCVDNPNQEIPFEQVSDTIFTFLMPATDVELEIYFMVSKSPFKDVKEGAFYYEPVLWAVSYGITSGISQTSFAPNDSCTRAQVVTFLWRAAGEPEPVSTKNPFTDVKESAYYYKAVLWAVENGITTGMSATSFAPNSPCTRGQVVTFLHRAAGGTDPVNSQNPFKDVKASAFYYEAVLWAVENGITTGMSATSFGPNSTCTRGQVVTFLYRFMNG